MPEMLRSGVKLDAVSVATACVLTRPCSGFFSLPGGMWVGFTGHDKLAGLISMAVIPALGWAAMRLPFRDTIIGVLRRGAPLADLMAARLGRIAPDLQDDLTRLLLAIAEVRLPDRRLFTATTYPADYGFVPDTLGGDGDPQSLPAGVPKPIRALLQPIVNVGGSDENYQVRELAEIARDTDLSKYVL